MTSTDINGILTNTKAGFSFPGQGQMSYWALLGNVQFWIPSVQFLTKPQQQPSNVISLYFSPSNPSLPDVILTWSLSSNMLATKNKQTKPDLFYQPTHVSKLKRNQAVIPQNDQQHFAALLLFFFFANQSFSNQRIHSYVFYDSLLNNTEQYRGHCYRHHARYKGSSVTRLSFHGEVHGMLGCVSSLWSSLPRGTCQFWHQPAVWSLQSSKFIIPLFLDL